MKPVLKCDGCESFDCAHVDLPSVVGGRMRACPECGSHCVEHGSTYMGICKDCGRDGPMRKFFVEYPDGTMPVFMEQREDT